jgi:uncharacterized membrane protein YciS (DUF1049 family)
MVDEQTVPHILEICAMSVLGFIALILAALWCDKYIKIAKQNVDRMAEYANMIKNKAGGIFIIVAFASLVTTMQSACSMIGQCSTQDANGETVSYGRWIQLAIVGVFYDALVFPIYLDIPTTSSMLIGLASLSSWIFGIFASLSIPDHYLLWWITGVAIHLILVDCLSCFRSYKRPPSVTSSLLRTLLPLLKGLFVIMLWITLILSPSQTGSVDYLAANWMYTVFSICFVLLGAVCAWTFETIQEPNVKAAFSSLNRQTKKNKTQSK